MKITEVRIRRFKMERLDPTWKTATYAASTVEGFLLGIVAHGMMGIGGTAAHPSAVRTDVLESQLNGPVRHALEGADPTLGNLIRQQLSVSNIHPRACVAADLALYDLVGKVAGLPCHALWGGALRSKVKVVRMVGIKPVAQLQSAVEDLVNQGYRHFKVKIGTGLAEDAERIRKLRDTFGNDVWLAVDGNGAYTPEQAIALSRALEPYNVSLIEQPTDYRDVPGLAKVTSASKIPIMADQCVRDVESALAVCRLRAAHVVSIKATSIGSLHACRRVYEVCRSFGMRVHFGGSVTSAIVDIAQTQLAASLEGVDQECEVGEFMAVRGEPVAGVHIQDGEIEIARAPGWGISLDPNFEL